MIPALTSRIVLSTTGSAHEASTIARTLVEEKLAACVNILPAVHSIYQWKGRIHNDAEWMLLIKTSENRVAALEARIRDLHSYENPEFLVIVPESGSKAYLLWIDQCLSQITPEQPPAV